MTAITIDQRYALVLIDLHEGILALPTLLSPDDIKNRARRLAAAFRATALPVVRVKLAFSADGGDLPPCCSTTPPRRGSTPPRSASAASRPAAT
jgi:nicotinamidase-related amidase